MKRLTMSVAAAALAATTLTAAPALAAGLNTVDRASATTSSAPARVSNAVTYTQVKSTVTLRQRGRVLAAVRLYPITRHGSSGRVVVNVSTRVALTIRAANFVWEDRQGGENAPLNHSRVVHVRPGTTRITLDYRHITPGAVAWVPTTDVAGTWRVD